MYAFPLLLEVPQLLSRHQSHIQSGFLPHDVRKLSIHPVNTLFRDIDIEVPQKARENKAEFGIRQAGSQPPGN